MSFLMSNIMTSHCNDSTLKGVIKPQCNGWAGRPIFTAFSRGALSVREVYLRRCLTYGPPQSRAHHVSEPYSRRNNFQGSVFVVTLNGNHGHRSALGIPPERETGLGEKGGGATRLVPVPS